MGHGHRAGAAREARRARRRVRGGDRRERPALADRQQACDQRAAGRRRRARPGGRSRARRPARGLLPLRGLLRGRARVRREAGPGMAGPLAVIVALALQHGVQLPAESPSWVTWDPALRQTPNRSWRRWGTRKLVATTELVLDAYHDAHPDSPRVLVGDLSRHHGGYFGARYGGLGHLSHQNRLYVDVYYPRLDGLGAAPRPPPPGGRAAAPEPVDPLLA